MFMWIMRTRFKDTTNCKVLEKRRSDWLADLNMNLITGKVIRSTHYFNTLEDDEKLSVLRVLDSEPGNREDGECRIIEPFVRSMSLFKPYSDFEFSDFLSVLQEIKLLKVRAGTRITNYGEASDSIFFIINGRVALTHPNA